MSLSKEISSLISTVFLLDKDRDPKQFQNELLNLYKTFARFTEDEKQDFIFWMRYVLASKRKGINSAAVNEVVANLEKGDVESMTYAVDRMYDVLIAEGRAEERQARLAAEKALAEKEAELSQLRALLAKLQQAGNAILDLQQ